MRRRRRRRQRIAILCNVRGDHGGRLAKELQDTAQESACAHRSYLHSWSGRGWPGQAMGGEADWPGDACRKQMVSGALPTPRESVPRVPASHVGL